MSESAVNYHVSSGSRANRSDLMRPEREQSHVIHEYRGTFPPAESLRFRPAQRSFKKNDSRKQQTVRVKRRLKGFLVELQGKEARVAFVEDGETIIYDLPADQILRAGIKVRNQPFQMDEIETADEYGNSIVGYRFSALAKPSDAYIETLDFDEERQRKRALVLKEFGKS